MSESGIELTAKERQRQIEIEGYTPERDSHYSNDELFMAGCCYLASERTRAINKENYDPYIPPNGWPWSVESWKPSPDNRIKELVKAGALFRADYDLNGKSFSLDQMNICVNEIDRLLRLERRK